MSGNGYCHTNIYKQKLLKKSFMPKEIQYKIFDANFKEIFWSQLVSIFGGLIAGSALALYTDQLLLIPSMLILLPGFLEMRANISAPMASRLSSGLFLGIIKPKGTNQTKKNIIH